MKTKDLSSMESGPEEVKLGWGSVRERVRAGVGKREGEREGRILKGSESLGSWTEGDEIARHLGCWCTISYWGAGLHQAMDEGLAGCECCSFDFKGMTNRGRMLALRLAQGRPWLFMRSRISTRNLFEWLTMKTDK